VREFKAILRVRIHAEDVADATRQACALVQQMNDESQTDYVGVVTVMNQPLFAPDPEDLIVPDGDDRPVDPKAWLR
jgi:hypothetical protein